MNAPAIQFPAQAALDTIPLKAIRPSRTQIQQLRRSHLNAVKLLELADSIKAQGVLQPILVRPVHAEGPIAYELIAGERRWLAADRAGLTHIDCNVRELSDEQVIEAQLVENGQREDTHPLEEAEGFRELLGFKTLTAEAIGALIGKSRAYVYARLKLLELCPEAIAAVDAGELDASKALLIARFKGHKLQKQALRRLGNSPQYSYQYAVTVLRDQFMIDLARAPFALDDATLCVTRPKEKGTWPVVACHDCPQYSRNDPELQASFRPDAHICTDRVCYDAKVLAFHGRARLAAEQAGRTVLIGDAAQAAIPDRYDGVNDRYVDLDAPCSHAIEFAEPAPDDMNSPEGQAWDERADRWDATTFRQLLDAALAESAVLAEDETGKLRALVPIKEAIKHLKTKGIRLDPPAPARQMSFAAADTEAMKALREKHEKQRERELEFRRRIFAQIHAKWKGPLKRADLAQVAERLMVYGATQTFSSVYPKEPVFDRMNEAELSRLVVLLSVYQCVDNMRAPGPLLDLAKRLKIDPAKIKKDLAAEAKAKDKPAASANPIKRKG